MRKHLLLLNLYLMKNNLGSLVFKNGDISARIERLCDTLQFAGKMKQLSMAIETGANQDCAYQLVNAKGSEWVLACRFTKGIVALELWFQQLGFNERVASPFNWQGTMVEFRDAVNRMIDKMGRYRFCWF